MALQELVSQGHDLNQLVDGYPASLVKGLLAGLRLERRYRLAEHTMALSVAVVGALDLALNQGKGKVLEGWVKAVLPEGGEKARRPRVSDRALAVFASLPKRKV